jgi:flagellar basal body-associated protein FliL
MKIIKLTFFVVLALAVAQLTMVASFAQEAPQGIRSESAVLEEIYQDKAKVYLDKLLNPKDYTLVVTTSLKNDEAKLKEYKDAVDNKYLPGLPITDPRGFMDAQNILMGLKQKAEIQVILTDNVPADRDALVKDLLKTNLKLNEESGDTVTVVRATRSIASVDTQAPEKLRELSGKMIAFWIFVALLALAGLALWFYRYKEKQHEEEEAETAEGTEGNLSGGSISRADGEDEEDEAVEPPKTPEQIEHERDELEMKLAFAKAELTKLSSEYPNIVCRAIEEYGAQGKMQDTVIFLEALGWENSKRLFNEMVGRMWTRVGIALRAREEDPTLQEIYQAVHVFHRFALSFVLERTGRDTDNPFNFVFQLTEWQRIDLLTSEKPENIALIAIYCAGAQMGELLVGLSTEKQNQVLLNIAKIKQLPESEIQEGVTELLMRLERIKASPSVHVDGSMLAADFMRSLPPAREEELYHTLLSEHPEEAEKLRRVRVMFQDIPYYPQETVRRVLESYESEEILKALIGFDGVFTEQFLQLFPTKKALMIQNDLYHLAEYPATSVCAEHRRRICVKLESEFELVRFSVVEFWRTNSETEVQTVNEYTSHEFSDTHEITQVQEIQEDVPAVFEDDGNGENSAA